MERGGELGYGPGTAGQQPAVSETLEDIAMPVATNENNVEEVVVGVAPELRATLPLSASERFLATDRQLDKIGHAAVKLILAEPGSRQRLDFSQLRDEINRRTGIGDTMAALVAWSVEGQLETSDE